MMATQTSAAYQNLPASPQRQTTPQQQFLQSTGPSSSNQPYGGRLQRAGSVDDCLHLIGWATPPSSSQHPADHTFPPEGSWPGLAVSSRSDGVLEKPPRSTNVSIPQFPRPFAGNCRGPARGLGRPQRPGAASKSERWRFTTIKTYHPTHNFTTTDTQTQYHTQYTNRAGSGSAVGNAQDECHFVSMIDAVSGDFGQHDTARVPTPKAESHEPPRPA